MAFRSLFGFLNVCSLTDYIFCPECGSKLENISNAEILQAIDFEISQESNKIKQKKGEINKSVIIVILVIAVILLIVGITGMIITSQRNERGSVESIDVYSLDEGDTLTFGSYEQDNNKLNGKEAIEWTVVKDFNDTVLLISNYSLDEKPYNETSSPEDTTAWDKCSLREWLNDSFYNSAFSKAEQNLIVTASVETMDFYGDNRSSTDDKVFLLSTDEVKSNFYVEEWTACQPTEYAFYQERDKSVDYESFFVRSGTLWSLVKR